MKSLINNRGEKEYHISGPLFFNSSARFKSLFTPKDDPKDIIIDFKHSRVCDHSAIDAIQIIADAYSVLNKRIHLRHLSQECKTLLGKAAKLVETDATEDPTYHVASDRLG